VGRIEKSIENRITMKELVFATGNPNKVREANLLLADTKKYKVVSLSEKNILEDIPETGESLTENALMKAVFINQKYNCDCFSEDTGLEVNALEDEPGIFSARYAGPERNDKKNIDLVLKKLRNVTDRTARFRTVICLILDGEKYIFEGITSGKIHHSRKGNGGFGYDPIFIPDGERRSFAEMTHEEKTRISHRGRAIKKLIKFLDQK
jgi:XTP/dITP diphosphohydrolase